MWFTYSDWSYHLNKQTDRQTVEVKKNFLDKYYSMKNILLHIYQPSNLSFGLDVWPETPIFKISKRSDDGQFFMRLIGIFFMIVTAFFVSYQKWAKNSLQLFVSSSVWELADLWVLPTWPSALK